MAPKTGAGDWIGLLQGNRQLPEHDGGLQMPFVISCHIVSDKRTTAAAAGERVSHDSRACEEAPVISQRAQHVRHFDHSRGFYGESSLRADPVAEIRPATPDEYLHFRYGRHVCGSMRAVGLGVSG